MTELLPEQGDQQPADPQEEAWSGPTREEWEEYRAFKSQVDQAQADYERQQAAQQQPVPLDWLDEDSQQQLAQFIDQRLAPLHQFQERAALQEGDERAMAIMDDIVTREGDFLFEESREKARALADTYWPAVVQQYGPTRQAAETALERAAKDVRQWEQQVGKAYYDREVGQLRNLTSARREPGAAGTGAAQQQVVGGLGNVPNAVTSKLFGQP